MLRRTRFSGCFETALCLVITFHVLNPIGTAYATALGTACATGTRVAPSMDAVIQHPARTHPKRDGHPYVVEHIFLRKRNVRAHLGVGVGELHGFKVRIHVPARVCAIAFMPSTKNRSNTGKALE
jgi:hypothetical protein